jgi:predicted dehydrogenase
MGSEVTEVTTCISASSNPIFKAYEYPTTTVTLLKFENGKVGKVASVIDCLQPYYFHIHLVGSEGSLLDNRIYSSRLPGLTTNRWSVLETSLIDSGDVTDHPYLPQFRAFVEAVNSGTEMPLTNFDLAFESHRVAFAADRSGEVARPVKLEEFPV